MVDLFLSQAMSHRGKRELADTKDGCIDREVEAPQLIGLQYSMKWGVEKEGEKEEVKGIGFFFIAAFDHHLLKLQKKRVC